MNNNKIKVAIVGTNGIPARYGGYETLTEYLTRHLSTEFDFTVYCSNTQPKKHKNYNGSKLIYLPLNANGWQSLVYDTLSLIHAISVSDVILYLGPGAGFILPFLKIFGKVIIVNHGGLNEWEREKYSSFQRFVAKIGHKYAAKSATVNIADNLLLRESIKRTFGVDSKVIRYGGDHAVKVDLNSVLIEKYPFLTENYFVNVSRAQVDNNLHLVLEAFETLPDLKLVMVSNWAISPYGIDLKEKYKEKFSNIVLLDAVYEPTEINAIRSNAMVYIHSHSYCGTSPSLVEAMSLGLPIVSFDVPTNRETTENKALYFKNDKELKECVINANKALLDKNGNEMKYIAEREYTWENIASKYSELFRL